MWPSRYCRSAACTLSKNGEVDGFAYLYAQLTTNAGGMVERPAASAVHVAIGWCHMRSLTSLGNSSGRVGRMISSRCIALGTLSAHANQLVQLEVKEMMCLWNSQLQLLRIKTGCSESAKTFGMVYKQA